MSTLSEITRLQNAKASLKTSLNAKNDEDHQITTETIDDYPSFVDSIETGIGDVVNGVIRQYLSSSGTIDANTFIEFVNSTSIQESSTKIEGLTKTACTTSVAGDVWILPPTPKPYTPVEYIEATGTQYINTGVNVNSDINVEMDAQMTSISDDNHLFGGMTGTTTDRIRFMYVKNTGGAPVTFWFYFASGNYPYTSSIYSSWNSTNYLSRHVYKSVKYDLYVDGTKQPMTYYGTESKKTIPFTTEIPLYLGASNVNNESIMGYGKVKIYSTKIWENDTLLRDFIPVIDENGIPCMYDKVSGRFFYNAGTGQFKTNLGYTPVKYIASTGSQRINTQYQTTTGFRAEMKINLNIPSSGHSYIIGSYVGGVRSYLSIYRNTTYLGMNTDVQATPTLENATDLVIDVSTISGEGYLKVNDETRATSTNTYTQSSSYPIWLFAVNKSGSPLLTSMAGKLYYCKIYNTDGNLIRNFIPVLDSSNVACLYDLASKSFYYNVGSGSFTYEAL